MYTEIIPCEQIKIRRRKSWNLCQIPGISSVTAIAIMDKFKTISDLLQEIELNDDCLNDITTTNTKGQTRKINKSSLSNIVKFLLKK